MTTQQITNPVRSDLPTEGPSARPERSSRAWALAGVGAAVAGLAGTVLNGLANRGVYDPDLMGDPDLVRADLGDHVAPLVGFHTAVMVAAVLLVPFAAGLHQRLKAARPDGTAPLVAFGGLLGTAVVLVLGTGLDTEVLFGVGDDGPIDGTFAVAYGHWIGTVPWIWGLAGLAGLAVWSVARTRGVPRWLGYVGLVLGGLTVLIAVSPMQYLAVVPGALWVLVTAVGFLVGDRAAR